MSWRGEVKTKRLTPIRTKSLFSAYNNSKLKNCLSKKSSSSLSQHCGWYFTTEGGILAKYWLILSKWFVWVWGVGLLGLFVCFPTNLRGAYYIFPLRTSKLLDFSSEWCTSFDVFTLHLFPLWFNSAPQPLKLLIKHNSAFSLAPYLSRWHWNFLWNYLLRMGRKSLLTTPFKELYLEVSWSAC